MSSSALPPLTGVGSREDREEQRTQKVKPLPLMLSSRAPLVQAAGSSPGQGATRGRPPAGQPPQPQQLQPPHHLYPAGNDAPPSPGSPTAQQTPLRSKFTRIRGFQGAPPLGLEGSGLLLPQPGVPPPGSGGRPGSQGPPGGSPEGGGGGGQTHHSSWDGGPGSPGLVTSPQRLGSGGRPLGGGGGGGVHGSNVGVVAPGASMSLPEGTWQQGNGAGGSGAPVAAPPGAAAAWAARRNGLAAERSGLGSSHSHHSHQSHQGLSHNQQPQQHQHRLREASPFDGALGAGLILGPNTTGLSLAAVGNAPQAFRLPNSAPPNKHYLAPGPLPGAVGRPDTAPSSPPLPPPPPTLDHLLAATFPARGPGLVPPAVINPPLQLANPAGRPVPGQPEGASAADAELLLAAAAPGHAAAAADATSEAGSPPRQLPQQQQPSSQQPSATAAQLLQRLFRTNRTPPSQTESLQELLSPGQRQQQAPTAASGGGGGGGGGGSPGARRPPAASSGAAAGPLLTAPTSLLLPPPPPSAATAAVAPPPPPPGQQLRAPSRSLGGGGTAATSLSGQAPASAVTSRPGTTNTIASSSLNASLLSRPRGRNAAAGTLADLSAALQKSIAAGMGEWDLRADGTWGHPEIQQRLLRGPLGPEALKNRYRMQERDIISLYRLLYSYSVGFFTDVEALLDIAVSDRNSGAAVGLAAGTSLRQELLENVFRSFAALWDEALMIVFDSEMSSMLADKNAALQALDRGAVELEALKREKQELQSRLEDFMKQNVDNMLASRHLQQATTKLEGEVYTLHNANEQLVTHMARHAVQVATLERQLDAAKAATQAAEARAVAAEAHLHDLKAIVSEQNATLSAQFFQIKELERMCGELQETVRNLNRRRAAVLGLLSGNTPEPSDPGAAGATAGGAGSAAASPTTAGASGTLTVGGNSATAATTAGLAGTSSRALGPGSVSGGATTRGPTADGVASPGTPPSGGGGGGGGGGATAAATATLPSAGNSGNVAPYSTTEGMMADLSLLDPDELGRLLSDKTRAFNLMHANFVVKMHELDEQRAVNESLRAEVADMKAAVARADDAAAASDRIADKFRAKFEAGRMAMEDLEERNRKLTLKNSELVRSYWPLMTRLKEAEEEAARCREEAARDREQAEADRAEADVLRAAAADTKALLQELEERRAEANSHELELPPDLLALLPEGQVLALRRFARSCHRRVAHLNSQVVALVDQVTQARLAAVLSKEQQLLSGGGGEGAGGSGGPFGAAAASAESAVSASLAEVAELRAAVEARDKWLAVLNKAMSALLGQMENLMARDWETCRTLRLEQDRRKRRAAREARRAAAAAARQAGAEISESGQLTATTSASMPASPERSIVSVRSDCSNLQSASSMPPALAVEGVAEPAPGDGGGESPSAEPSAAPALPEPLRSGTVSAETSTAAAAASPEPSAMSLTSQPSAIANSPAAAADGEALQQPEGAEGDAAGDGGGDAGMEGNDGDIDLGDDGMTVAAGRLAQMVGVGRGADGVECSHQLVALDRTFDRLADSAERLIEWSEGLLKRKEQTATFSQVRQKLETVSRQLDAANLELTTLRPTADALRQAVRGYEIKFKEMSTTMTNCKQRAETAESRLESVEAQLSVVTQQLREAQDAQKLLEGEYWKAKDIALDAEVNVGELKAGRIRALEAAAKALASVTGLEKEARENRDQRVALEADLVGYKAWVRHMEVVERKYRDTLKELADATGLCEERDRKLAELRDRIATLEQQLRFKSIEAASLESRVKALSGELVEERRAARMAVAEAHGATAAQLDAAIRQAGAAEAEAAARGERVAVLESRLAEVSQALDEAQTAASAAEARLVPLTAERDRLRAHIAATQPLLQAMDKAADAIGRRIALLEDAAAVAAAAPPPPLPITDSGTAAAAAAGSGSSSGNHVHWFGLVEGSLERVLAALLDKVDGALDAAEAVAAEAAGDATPALLGALEGLVTQLLSTLSKGGQEPIQSLAVLKAQLARDDKELVAVRAAMSEVRTAGEAAAREAAEQRMAATAAAKAATAAAAAAVRDGRRAVAAEAALMALRRDLDTAVEQLQEARLVAETAKRKAERSQKRAAELETDLASAHSQRRHYEAQAAAATQKISELKRRCDDLEAEGLRDQDAAREARVRAEAAAAAAEAAALRCEELQAEVAAERREAMRLRGDAEAALAVAEAARERAVTVEQEMLESQAKYADMIRHDESMEERLRQAQFEAENMRKKAAEAMAEAAEVNAQYEALQQRAWQLQVALQAKHGEKEDVLRELVEVTHGAAARRGAAAAVGSASVKQRAEGTHETAISFKAKRTNDK